MAAFNAAKTSRIAFRRTEAHYDVIGLNKCFQPRLKGKRKIECRQGALSHDHRMHKFHGDVLSVCRVRPISKSQKPAATKKSLRHFTASLRQPAGLPGEEGFHDLISCEQSLFDLRRQCKACGHRAL